MSDEFSKLMRLVRVTANATVDLARHACRERDCLNDGRDRVGGSYRHKRCSECPLNEVDALSEADGVCTGDHVAETLADEAAAEIRKLKAALEELRDWASRIAHDERVCGWLHAQDYSLYCLLADCPVDFAAILAAQPGEALAVVREMQGAIAATLAPDKQSVYGTRRVISSLASAEESARRLFGEPQA